MSKVFVVDDSIGACVAIERILGGQGFDVTWERQGETGLMTVEKHAPDLILCDLVMPDIDGYEFCRSVKENPLMEGVPVMIMSGIADDEVHRRAREIGVEAVLPKPFTPEELIAAVESMLRRDPEDAEGEQERWATVLESLVALHAVRFACVLDSEGRALAGTRGASDDSDPEEIARFADSAAGLSQRLGMPRVRGMTLESDEEILIFRSVAEGRLLVVALDDRCFLGKVRYLIRKWEKELAGSDRRAPEGGASNARRDADGIHPQVSDQHDSRTFDYTLAASAR